MALAVLLDLDRQRKAAGAADPGAFCELRPAQAASGREQRQRFKEISSCRRRSRRIGRRDRPGFRDRGRRKNEIH